MTKVTKKPAKKSPGRPKKVAADKPGQFSIRLLAPTKFGLEVIARDRTISLSQAAELAIAMLLRDYDVTVGDGLSVKAQQIVDEYSQADGLGKMRAAFDESVTDDEQTRMALKTVLLMPPRLRTKEEEFLIECLKAQAARTGTGKIKLVDVAGIMELAPRLFRSGGTLDDVLLAWNV